MGRGAGEGTGQAGLALGCVSWRTQMQSGSAGLTATAQPGSVRSLSAFSVCISCVTAPRQPSFLEPTSMPPRWKFCKPKETMTSVLSADHSGHLTGLHTTIAAQSHPSPTWYWTHLLKPNSKTSLLVQWLSIHLPILQYSCLKNTMGRGVLVSFLSYPDWGKKKKRSTSQCRGYRFDLWPGKIPCAAEQLSPWATIIEPGL